MPEPRLRHMNHMSVVMTCDIFFFQKFLFPGFLSKEDTISLLLLFLYRQPHLQVLLPLLPLEVPEPERLFLVLCLLCLLCLLYLCLLNRRVPVFRQDLLLLIPRLRLVRNL